MIKSKLIGLFCLIVCVCQLHAVKSQINASWFQSHDQGNRYEGTYDGRGIAKLSVDLVSFTGMKQTYAFGEQQD